MATPGPSSSTTPSPRRPSTWAWALSGSRRGGYLKPVTHAFEKGFYVLEGAPVVVIDGRAHQLGKDHYGLVRLGMSYAVYNAGPGPVRLLEMSAPQPKPDDSNFRDTLFQHDGGIVESAEPPDLRDPRVNAYLGRFDDSQLPDAGDIAAVGARSGSIHGVAIKEFIDRMLGAQHLAMFMVQFRPGGMGTQHDHPLEESYFVLQGEAEAVLDGKTYRISGGGYVWTGVGCFHSFRNVGTLPVRWIETQAPLPTPIEAFRFRGEWDPMAERIEGRV